MNRYIILCVGMHRSGTSLAASIIRELGVKVPGELIKADSANLAGYFENQTIVNAQENLLKELGYWWPSERASNGLPDNLLKCKAVRKYLAWLTIYLGQILNQESGLIAIKDPRTSLLLPVWREAAWRLGIRIKLLICLRNPRDVCWSLVWRDGLSVGMGWKRAQKLWLMHYKTIYKSIGSTFNGENLVNGIKCPGITSKIVNYEAWFQPQEASKQLASIQEFLEINSHNELASKALENIRIDLNHSKSCSDLRVNKILAKLHRQLAKEQRSNHQVYHQIVRLWLLFSCFQFLLNCQEYFIVILISMGFCKARLGLMFDRKTVKHQLGSSSLSSYFFNYPRFNDLRPHPLISPRFMNEQRLRQVLPPFHNAFQLFHHLLFPDLIPLDPHPWFHTRYFQLRKDSIATHNAHPIKKYLEKSPLEQPSTSPRLIPPLNVPWLIAIGAHFYPWRELNLPGFIEQMNSSVILLDLNQRFGKPSEGEIALLAHEGYWREINDLFSTWPDQDSEGPLRWILQQPNIGGIGLVKDMPDQNYSLSWPQGQWEVPLLTTILNMNIVDHFCFNNIEYFNNEFNAGNQDKNNLIALTEPVFENIIANKFKLPKKFSLINLMWPRSSQQSAWLHLLASAEIIIECRPAIRAYLCGFGLNAIWKALRNSKKLGFDLSNKVLLLATSNSLAEMHFSTEAAKDSLDANKYDAYFRLDTHMESFMGGDRDAAEWLARIFVLYKEVIWLSFDGYSTNSRVMLVQALAEKYNIKFTLLSEEDWFNRQWIANLSK